MQDSNRYTSEPLTKSEPLIVVNNLSINLHGQTILKDINFQLAAKEILTIIGPNGAGKSTLIKTILGLITPSTGTVLKNPKLSIGYIPQKIFFPEQIPINVISFLKLHHNPTDYSITALLEANAALNIQHLLTNSIHKLSGGELQRVLLAKALLNQPNLLILDEPTKSLDLNGQMEFYQLCSNLQQQLGCAILMASHDLHIVMSGVSRVICLNKHICCHGTPAIVSQHVEFIKLFGENISKLAFYSHNHDHKHN